jgi:hypothetical protein
MSSRSRGSVHASVPPAQLESSATFEDLDDAPVEVETRAVPTPSVSSSSIAQVQRRVSLRRHQSEHPGKILGKQSKIFGQEEAKARILDWIVFACGFLLLAAISVPLLVIRYSMNS